MKTASIGIIVVTYNRLQDLKIALKSYDEQSCRPSYIIVVNNNSTDGTAGYLQEWQSMHGDYDKHVITLPTNTGGSGGFYEGLKKALQLEADWIWVADDDAFPDASAIEVADTMIRDKNVVGEDVTAICGAVLFNGKVDLMHRRRFSVRNLRLREVPVPLDEYEKDWFELQLFSYVGTMLRKDVLQQVGLPKKEYFIYYDDSEHAMRFHKRGRILCFPAIKIVHKISSENQTTSIDWRYYYAKRNKWDFLKTHFSSAVYLSNYFLEILKARWHLMLKRKTVRYTIRLEAAQDAHNGRLGLHETYKPGWSWKSSD